MSNKFAATNSSLVGASLCSERWFQITLVCTLVASKAKLISISVCCADIIEV